MMAGAARAPAAMARTAPVRLTMAVLAVALLQALQACGPQKPAASLDDALRAYEAGRYAEALRTSVDVRTGSADAATRAQASYVEGCAAQELGRRDQARDAFAVSAGSSDPIVAGRSMVMQANMAVADERWPEAERLYNAAAGRLRGRDAELAREQARDAAGRAAAAARPAPPPSLPPTPPAQATDRPPPGPAEREPEDGEADDRKAPLLPEPDDDAPWTISAGVFGTESAAQARAANIAKMAKAAKLPTPKVLAVSSPERRVWVVEVGSFADRAKAEAARKKIATGDAQVVRSRVPQSRK
jgi:hypothetical protein